jgi:hypothetical protein
MVGRSQLGAYRSSNRDPGRDVEAVEANDDGPVVRSARAGVPGDPPGFHNRKRTKPPVRIIDLPGKPHGLGASWPTPSSCRLVEPTVTLTESIDLMMAEETQINAEHHSRLTNAEADDAMSRSGLPREHNVPEGVGLPDWSSGGWDWELMPWDDGLIIFLYSESLGVALNKGGSVAIVRPNDENKGVWELTRSDAVFASLGDFAADCMNRANVGLLMWFLDVLEETQAKHNPLGQS